MVSRVLGRVLLVCVLGVGVPAQGVDVVHPPGMDGMARRIRILTPRMLARAKTYLELGYDQKLRVRIVEDQASFDAALREEGSDPRPPFVAAVAFPWRDVIILKAEAWQTGSPGAFEAIYQHELVHCVLGAAERKYEVALPVWLHEGIAEWVAEKPFYGDPAILGEAVRRERLIPFAELVKSFPRQEGASRLAYAQAHSVVRALADFGEGPALERRNIPILLRLLLRGERFEDALRLMTGLSLDEFESLWRGEVRRRSHSGLNWLPEFLFSGFLTALALLVFGVQRARRDRAMRRMEEEEALEGPESFPYWAVSEDEDPDAPPASGGFSNS